MLKAQVFEIASIRVPVKRARTVDPAKVTAIAESLLEGGQTTPIMVRPDGEAYILVEGLHRIEARKALGETTIEGYVVQARKH
jgi:sulfiredoxin